MKSRSHIFIPEIEQDGIIELFIEDLKALTSSHIGTETYLDGVGKDIGLQRNQFVSLSTQKVSMRVHALNTHYYS